MARRTQKQSENLLDSLQSAHVRERREWQVREGIPDSLMVKLLSPPEWRRRERPPCLWDHVLPLPDAFEKCGKAKFGNEWQGTPEKPVEWHARSPNIISAWNDPRCRESRYLACMATWTGFLSYQPKMVDFSGKEEAENSAYICQQAVYKILIKWLEQGKINAFTVAEDGSRLSIPAHEWLQGRAFAVLAWGRKSGEEREREAIPSRDPEAVYLDNDQFSETLSSIAPKLQRSNAGTNRGRPEKYNWTTFHAELTRKIHDDGVPTSQAELENYMAEWCMQQWGSEPSESTIREKISSTYRALSASSEGR